MTALLRAELARVRARPLVLGMLLLVLLGGAGLVLSGWWSTRPPSATQLEAAQARLAEMQARAQEGGMVPTLEMFLPYRPGLGEILAERLPTFGTLAMLAMVMTAAGLVTAEFRSGRSPRG